ncbi:hypothetical protein FORC066_2641 [Yersinia enterocolitica]|nr:hypothetical protein FORC066_2641 [Yersinia enterocolitica]
MYYISGLGMATQEMVSIVGGATQNYWPQKHFPNWTLISRFMI